MTYDDSDGILCRPGGPRHPDTPGPYCAPLACYCPGSRKRKRGHEPYRLPAPSQASYAGSAAGAAARAAGERAARNALDVQTWNEQARRAVLALAASGEPFTSEDVTARVGLPRGGIGTNRNNAVGALLSGAARRGLLRKTGRMVPSRRESSHGAALTEWVGQITERDRRAGS